MGIRCKRPKLELEHDDGPDYDEGKKSKELQKQVASALKNKKVMLWCLKMKPW